MKPISLLLLLGVLAANTPATAAEPADNSTPDSTTPESSTKTLVWPDGTRYVGTVVDGKRSGKGTIFWQDGTRFVGSFKNDLRNGPGTMILPDGTVYTGFFENDVLVDNQVSARTAEMAEPVASVSAEDLAMQAPVAVVAATVADASDTSDTKPSLEAESRQALENAVNKWANAWSSQDIDGYLGSYAETFVVPGGQSRSKWEALRKSRVQKPKSIAVKVDFTAVKLTTADTAEVRFTQAYNSDRYSDTSRKVLLLARQGDTWLITKEIELAEDAN